MVQKGLNPYTKCRHSWHFSYKPRGGPRYRFSLDAELGRHVEGKTEAQGEADKIRADIRVGTFRRAGAATPSPLPVVTTVKRLAESYLSAVKDRGKRSANSDASMLARLCAYQTADGRTLSAWPTSDITEGVLEAFYSGLQAAGLAASTRNHYTTLLKSLFRWAARKGVIARSPISNESSLRRALVAQRRRRLSPNEEAAIIATAGALTRGAGPRVQWLIVEAVETGARLGELLAIRWADVNLEKRRLITCHTQHLAISPPCGRDGVAGVDASVRCRAWQACGKRFPEGASAH